MTGFFDLSESRGLAYLRDHQNEVPKKGDTMKAEFTAIIEPASEGGYWALCPEIPGANGQGETIEEAINNLREAIKLILEDRREDILRGLPADAIHEKVLIA
jgi:predicted RNase H-like HicB family nuclease